MRQEGLKLEAIEPVGLRMTEQGPVRGWFLASSPFFSSDDFPSHKCPLRFGFQHLDPFGVGATDGFFDCGAARKQPGATRFQAKPAFRIGGSLHRL